MIGRTWVSGLLALCALGTACAPEETACPAVEGFYMPLYIPLSGTCGTIDNANRVNFDGGKNGVTTHIENRLDAGGMVVTEIVLKGCSLRMTQTVSDSDGLASMIDGQTIDIVTETELAGTVTVTRYDDAGQEECWGTYDASFNKNTQIIGAAAQ